MFLGGKIQIYQRLIDRMYQILMELNKFWKKLKK